MKLNQEQMEAVIHKDGPMLVLAGPGSGKTSVITARTENLIEKYHIAPSSILVVTFTKAAAGEMKERFYSRNPGAGRQVTFGTFHGIFYGILKHAYGIGSNNIAGDDVRRSILREMIEATDMEVEDEKDVLDLLEGEISQVKSEGINLGHFYSSACPEEIFRRIYQGYHKEMKRRRLLDFDDLMTQTYRLFVRRPEILKAWQKRYPYIMIDEFQDINSIQYRIMKMLAGENKNIFVVGDDDQSIYRFRGAKPEILFAFERDFPEAKRVTLRQNYRCSGAVVRCSKRLISCNKKRFEKDIITENPAGVPVDLHRFPNTDSQSEYLMEEIGKLLKEGVPCQEIAVLFRTNTLGRLLLTRLMEYNIPFRLRDHIPGIYDHWIAKQVLAYLRLSRGGRSRSDLLLVMNRPKRYISRDAVDTPEFNFEQLYRFYSDKDWMCDRIEQLENDLEQMRGMLPFAAINYMRCGIGYNEYLAEYAAEHRINKDDLMEVLDEIQNSAKNYRTLDEWMEGIDRYNKALKEQLQEKNHKGIVLSTLHGAKGMEYDHVFILDLNEGVVPYRKAKLEEEIEEERRLLYVGMTRARKSLHLFYPQRRFEKKQEPSRFLLEISGG